MFLLDYRTVSVVKVWQLFSDNQKGVAILSMATHEGLVATGCEDGFLRVWPLDFSCVAVEAGQCDG